MRVKFRKGEQRKFMKEILKRTACPSLRSIIGRGIEVKYQTLKSYFNDNRTLPLELLNDLCKLAGIEVNKKNVKYLDENWGQKIGGKR